jgi:hypothetical protein
LKGFGGVGKTTACNIIANDKEVRLRFPDAVLWIQLGDEVSAATVVEQVADIVKATGGHSFADAIRGYGEKNLDKVKSKAHDWFQGKSILLVVDNVYKCDNDSVPDGNWINVLRDIPSARSCILFSTRCRRIAVESDEEPVKFEPLQSLEDQRTMFLKHLGIARADPKFDPGMCDNILSICGGVPLALATAAAFVKQDDFCWQSVWHDLNLFRAKKQIHGHPGLVTIFEAVLAKLDNDDAFLEREVGPLNSRRSVEDRVTTACAAHMY